MPTHSTPDDEKIIYNRRPRRKSRADLDIEQALADWFQASPVLHETKNMHNSLAPLISEVIARLPLDAPPTDPDILRKGWQAAAGDFISGQANLVSLVKGVATVQVLQPAMRYHLKQWEPALLEKLRHQFGNDTVETIRFIFG